MQYELTQDGLQHKREQLEDLEKSEREAKRLEEALGRGRVAGPSRVQPAADGEVNGNGSGSGNGDGEREAAQHEDDAPEDDPPSYTPLHPGPSSSRRRGTGMGAGFLNALSYTLHGMMDVDPETARRNGISKTRESISQVCTCSVASPPDGPFNRAIE